MTGGPDRSGGTSSRSISDQVHNGGSMFATFAVLLLLLFVVVLFVTLGSREPLRDGAIVAGVFVVLVSIFTGVRRAITNPITDYAAWVFRERRGDPLAGYEPTKKPAKVRQYGTNKPATADDVREIREQANVWTPSDARRKRKKR